MFLRGLTSTEVRVLHPLKNPSSMCVILLRGLRSMKAREEQVFAKLFPTLRRLFKGTRSMVRRDEQDDIKELTILAIIEEED